jgi:inactivated superfamily I helicase
MTEGLANVSIIEAANPEEEALAIAVALREAVQEEKTAALVTSDRGLARRVAAALGRWDITAEDSGGQALADGPAGVFARLAALAALHGAAPSGVSARSPYLNARSCVDRSRVRERVAWRARWRAFARSSANSATVKRASCIRPISVRR